MYIQEKKMILSAGLELKKRIPFLANWKEVRQKGEKGARPDIIMTAKRQGETYRFCIEVKTTGYPQNVRDAVVRLKDFTRHDAQCYPVLVVPCLNEQGKKICDEYDIGYVDMVGNAKIVYKNIFVEVSGKIQDRPQKKTRKDSIFSPKALRITKLVLYAPGKRWRQKDIAEETGLSKGMVSLVVKEMLEAGYLLMDNEGRLTLSNFEDLLAAWVDAYNKKRANTKRYYIWSQSPEKLMRVISSQLLHSKVKYAFTEEAGASLVAPFATFDIVSLYIESFDKFPAGRLSAEESSKGFNVQLIEPYDDAIFKFAQDIETIKVADSLQLYADLMKNPLRGAKQAEHLLGVIKNKLNEAKKLRRL